MSENRKNRRQAKASEPKGGRLVLAKKKDSEMRYDRQPKILLKPDREERLSGSQPMDQPIMSQEFVNRALQPNNVTIMTNTPETETKQMTKSVELVSSSSFVNPSVQEYLMDSNTFFKVIGVIGGDGVGKSTLLNLFAQNESTLTPFKVRESNLFSHSKGVRLFITNDRHFLIDTWPMLGNFNNPGKEHKLGEIEELKTLILLLKVCHTILVVQDEYFNLNLIRLIRCAEVMDFCFDKVHSNPEFAPNVIFVQNNKKQTSFVPLNSVQMLKTLFRDSKLNIYQDQSLKDLNFITIPSLNSSDCKEEVRKFRRSVNQKPMRQISTQTPFTETLWFQMVQQTWKLHKTNYFLNKYEKLNSNPINSE